jgi:hypothetical protein
MTAEEVRASLESREWNVTGETSPLYEWGLRSHPALRPYATEWYETGDDGRRVRTVPAHVERSPETLLAWFLFAGHIARSGEAPHVVFPFTSMNAKLRTILTLLEPFNPRVYSDSKAPEVEKRQDIHIRESRAFFEYIGDAPNDVFTCRWPTADDAVMADDREGATCPSCGRRYAYLSAHWDGDPDCGFPTLSAQQRAILTGLLLSGATLNQTGETKRPHLLLDSTNRPFLEWTQDGLGVLCAHVTHRTTSEQTTERLREWLGVESENTSDVYRLQTRSHPFFEDALTWADRFGQPSRDIHPPLNLERSPLLFATVYLHRGTFTEYTGQQRPVVRVQRMPLADDALLDLFAPFSPRFAHLTSDHRVLVIGAESAFFNYIGGPPAGLESLWPPSRR